MNIYGGPVSSTVTDPTATLSWRVRNSAWLLIPLLTLGCCSGALPGFDPARAARVVAERDARQGFRSVAEFGEAAGLTPDELRRLQYWLTV